MQNKIRVVSAALAGLALTGCAAPSSPTHVTTITIRTTGQPRPGLPPVNPIKEMARDSNAYSEKYFIASEIPVDTMVALNPDNQAPLGFKTLTIDGSESISTAGTRSAMMKFQSFMFNEGQGGLVRTVQNVTSNGLPVRVNFTLSYRGLQTLARQRGDLLKGAAPAIEYAKHVVSWPDEPSSIKENTTYSYMVSIGTKSQVMNFQDVSLKCRSGTFYDAAKFHSGLRGRAIDLDCEELNNNGVTTSRSQRVYLTDYGIALEVAIKTANATDRLQYDRIDAE